MRWRLHLRWPTSASPPPAPPSRRNPHQASGSRSLWHRRDAIFAAEAAYAEGHRDLPATVYMYVGEFERLGDGPRYNRNHDMVADNRRFEGLLRSRNYPGLTLTSDVLEDEDHLSVAPRGFSEALMTLLPAR